jgi:hypothetical protein
MSHSITTQGGRSSCVLAGLAKGHIRQPHVSEWGAENEMNVSNQIAQLPPMKSAFASWDGKTWKHHRTLRNALRRSKGSGQGLALARGAHDWVGA